MSASALLDTNNLVDCLANEVRAAGAEALCENIDLRRAPESFADVTLRFAGDAWADTPAGRSIVDRLTQSPWARSVRSTGGRLTFRFSDERIAALGQALEAATPMGLACADLLAGKTMFVDFHGANTTKALHIGHLRNIAVGHGFASVLRACGARVITQAHSSDFGRQMAESMAGYVAFHEGESPASTGMKPDHFVGDCYSRYVAQLAADEPGAALEDAPILREIEPASDLAQRILERLQQSDPEARALWSRMRTWAIEGHAVTVARLGVSLDVMRYESESIELGKGIVADGLARGILERTPDGAVVYITGRGEYPQMLLVRRDGLPTAHLRDFICLGVIMRTAREPIDAYIQFCGDEWANPVRIYRELLAKLRPEPFNEIHHMIFHGLVTQSGAKVASSGAEPPLVDGLLDRLESSPRFARMAASAPRIAPASLVPLIALGHFVSSPPPGPMEFAIEPFLTQRDAPGWQLAYAYCRANGGDASGAPDPDPGDAAYRFAVLQSQRLRGVLEGAVAARDPSRVAKYLLLLARFYLDAGRSARLDRVMRAILRVGLGSVGLIPAGEASA
jgi:arginyl-tRNA synthetase